LGLINLNNFLLKEIETWNILFLNLKFLVVLLAGMSAEHVAGMSADPVINQMAIKSIHMIDLVAIMPLNQVPKRH
jgi:hypothetical protein